MANLVGILTVFVVVVVGTLLFGDGSALHFFLAFLAFVVLSAIGLYCWDEADSPSSAREWMKQIIASPIIGGVYFLIDAIFGQLFDPSLGIIEGALADPLPDFALITAALLGVSVSGFVRSLYIQAFTGRFSHIKKHRDSR